MSFALLVLSVTGGTSQREKLLRVSEHWRAFCAARGLNETFPKLNLAFTHPSSHPVSLQGDKGTTFRRFRGEEME
ncbi:MAG: hypothetical protein ACRDF8_08920, partial [Chloroflexota bacterium]